VTRTLAEYAEEIGISLDPLIKYVHIATSPSSLAGQVTGHRRCVVMAEPDLATTTPRKRGRT
jgi:hypothetical protein